MANQVATLGAYISQAGGTVTIWAPASLVLQQGQIGWDAYPTVANLIAVGHQGIVAVPAATLITNIGALNNNQKNNIWTDFTTNKRYQTDTGPNAGSLLLAAYLANTALIGGSPTDLLNGKILAIALYVQDNPNYLVNPTFDSTINVPGTTAQTS